MALSFTLIPPISDIVSFEVNPIWCRQTGAFGSGYLVQPGTVLARVADKFLPIDFAGTGDAAIAVGISYEKVDAALADTKGVALLRGAVVDPNGLIWPDGATDNQKAAALAELELRGIVARASL